MRRLSSWVTCFRCLISGQASKVQVWDFPKDRRALWSMVCWDVRVSWYVHHNTWSGVGRCRRSAIRKIACRIAGARARLLPWDVAVRCLGCCCCCLLVSLAQGCCRLLPVARCCPCYSLITQPKASDQDMILLKVCMSVCARVFGLGSES